MVQVTYVTADGERTEIDVDVGETVMQGAVRNGVEGIVAECGGACACATCHVYVDEAWFAQVGPPAEGEAGMLEFARDTAPNSRLSCQIKLTDALDGLVVRIPANQC